MSCSAAEEKYRRVKLTNAKIKAALVDVSGAVDAMLTLGWVREEGGEDALVLPKGKFFTMAEVGISAAPSLIVSFCLCRYLRYKCCL